MLPSDLNIYIGKVVGYKNKILISNKDMKIDSNEDINKAEGVAHKTEKSSTA